MAVTVDDIPAPAALQLVPSHLAMLFAGTPATDVKLPPVYRIPLKIASDRTASLDPAPAKPVPTALQFVPSHFAIFVVITPPAVVNCPPIYKFPAASRAEA